MEKIYRKYNTQALILSNYDINYQEIPELLSPDLLLTYLINKMDIGISNYYKWLYSTMYELPAFNRFIAIDKNNKICDINNLGENLQKNYQLRENMQYKFFITEH